VSGRALAFTDPEIIRLARTRYIPVAGDDWYQRRRKDAEGKFFRRVADQGPRKGVGGSTRQGIYLLTADGTLLAFRNAQDPKVMREVLRQGLKKWNELPAARRKPDGIKVKDLGKVDPRFFRTPPKNGLIVNIYTRILDRDSKGAFHKGTCPTKGGDRPAHDHLWLTEKDCKAVVPARARKGDTFPMPAPVARRILRFHLVDNTRGEPPHWRTDQIRSGKMTLTVEEITAFGIRLRVDGTALLATDPKPEKADRGYDVRLLGYIHYDARKKQIDRFDVVAVGDHWGQGTFTPGARKGRKPLGVVFELVQGATAADQVPPQGTREIGAYLAGSR
jgi:hypothetical protein